MQNYFKYYRLFYSLFAFISLGAILYYQYSIDSFRLFQVDLILLPAIIVSVTGLVIMMICVKKYFYQLSGVQVLINKEDDVAPPVLEQKGLHKLVRHPLYLGTLLFVWGLFLIFPYLHNLIAVCIITIYTLIGIFFEEKKLLLEFGDTYKNYRQSVPMLIPFSRGKK